MLIENIRSHDYFKGLAELRTFEQVIDQIYYDVTYVTPWKPGTHKTQRASGMCSGLRGVSNAGIPSTCYMLLFKLYTLQITKAQIERLLSHSDSSFIRAIGLLYLRHCCDPKQLFEWYSAYLDDTETFDEVGDGSGTTTVGQFCRKLLTEQEFHDTMLPRLPVPIARDIQKKLDDSPLKGVHGTDATPRSNWESKASREGERGGGGVRDDAEKDKRDFRDLDSPDEGSNRLRRDELGAGPVGAYGGYERRDDWRDDHRSGHSGRDERSRDDYRGHGGGYGRDERGRDDRGRDERGYGRDERRDERGREERNRDQYRGGYGGRDERRDERRDYVPRLDYRGDRSRDERPSARDHDHGRRDVGNFNSGHGGGSYANERRDVYAAGYGATRAAYDDDTQPIKRARPDPAPVQEPGKTETAAEKLARLRAKQAARTGAVGFGTIGGDYAGGTSTAPAKGLQRYQQMVREGRQ